MQCLSISCQSYASKGASTGIWRAQYCSGTSCHQNCLSRILPSLDETAAVQLANERGAADINACMQHKGAATRTLINIDISSRRHIGYAIIAKCSASAQVVSGR